MGNNTWDTFLSLGGPLKKTPSRVQGTRTRDTEKEWVPVQSRDNVWGVYRGVEESNPRPVLRSREGRFSCQIPGNENNNSPQ